MADGAALSIQLTSTPPDWQLSEAITLLQEDMSCLTSQTLRSLVLLHGVWHCL